MNQAKSVKIRNTMKNSKERHDFIWIVGLISLFLVLWVFKIGELAAMSGFYFIGVISSLSIFYLGIFLTVKNPYKRGFAYLKESLNYIYTTVILFFIFAFIGFFFSENLRFLDEILRQIITKTQGLNVLEMIDFIFFNNLQVSFFGLFLGFFVGIFSFINVVSNGIVLGYVFSKLAEASRLNEFWRIFPHGIFELPAVFISLALGMKLGMFLFTRARNYELKRRIRASLLVFIFYVTPLLIIAAIIEGILIVFF
ncbi:MAG: stage II sporulation protein M [Nanoarchaeota archaeon]|nr:stage II sporulation protein M [Nanoarchaeota archaeon]